MKYAADRETTVGCYNSVVAIDVIVLFEIYQIVLYTDYEVLWLQFYTKDWVLLKYTEDKQIL